jgi:hypothetical protein
LFREILEIAADADLRILHRWELPPMPDPSAPGKKPLGNKSLSLRGV